VRLTREEQETIIIRNNAERTWHVYTDIPRDVRHLQKLASRWGVSAARNAPGDWPQATAILPLGATSFRGPVRRKNSRKPGDG
jgi:hypothetical protein